MRLGTLVAVSVTGVLAAVVLAVSALADLRSPDGTAELARSLADDPTVQSLLVGTVVDAIVADAAQRSPGLAPLTPLVRPLLTQGVAASVASPSGRAAVASTLSDALQQATRPGPIVVDLRAAALAAAAEAPPPLDTLARAAIEQGSVGLVVLGGDGSGVTSRRPPGELAGRVAGLPGNVALVLAVLALAVAVAVAGAREGRRSLLLAAGATLSAVGSVGAVAVRTVPGLIAGRIVRTADPDAGALAAVLTTVIDGAGALLSRTGIVALTLAIAGVAIALAAIVPGRLRRAGPLHG